VLNTEQQAIITTVTSSKISELLTSLGDEYKCCVGQNLVQKYGKKPNSKKTHIVYACKCIDNKNNAFCIKLELNSSMLYWNGKSHVTAEEPNHRNFETEGLPMEWKRFLKEIVQKNPNIIPNEAKD
jgi:hypothetical protein